MNRSLGSSGEIREPGERSSGLSPGAPDSKVLKDLYDKQKDTRDHGKRREVDDKLTRPGYTSGSSQEYEIPDGRLQGGGIRSGPQLADTGENPDIQLLKGQELRFVPRRRPSK